MTTASAGTLESMDCLVTITALAAGEGIKTEITGASAARFKTAMTKKILETMAELGAKDACVSVQDNGALDVVLGARVEAAWARLQRGND